MANPIIILGAGASKDYSIDLNPAPVTDELVKEPYFDSGVLNKTFKEAGDLFSDIRFNVLNRKLTFEQALRKIRDEVGNEVHRKKQFVSLEFYLQHIFNRVSSSNQRSNNYGALINKLRDHNQGKACVVTFNYDSLFEQSLPEPPSAMNHYVANDRNIKVIKVHGSHDWSYITDKESLFGNWGGYKNAYEFYTNKSDFTENLRKKNASPYHRKEIEKLYPEIKSRLFELPVIAVPIFEKKDSFLCPVNHIETLKAELTQADRVLMIGWSAGDTDLLDLMEKTIKASLPTLVVSRDQDSAEEICEKLSSRTKLECTADGSGFSSFVVSDTLTNFLKDEPITLRKKVFQSKA